MDTKYASGARQESNPPLQALAGVRVGPSLLGHRREKKQKTAVFSCTNAGDQLGSRPKWRPEANETRGRGQGGAAKES